MQGHVEETLPKVPSFFFFQTKRKERAKILLGTRRPFADLLVYTCARGSTHPCTWLPYETRFPDKTAMLGPQEMVEWYKWHQNKNGISRIDQLWAETEAPPPS